MHIAVRLRYYKVKNKKKKDDILASDPSDVEPKRGVRKLSKRFVSPRDRLAKEVRIKKLCFEILNKDICLTIYNFLDFNECCKFLRVSHTLRNNIKFYKRFCILSEDTYKDFLENENSTSLPQVLDQVLKYDVFFIKYAERVKYSINRYIYEILTNGKMYGTKCTECARHSYKDFAPFGEFTHIYSRCISLDHTITIDEYGNKTSDSLCQRTAQTCCYGSCDFIWTRYLHWYNWNSLPECNCKKGAIKKYDGNRRQERKSYKEYRHVLPRQPTIKINKFQHKQNYNMKLLRR